MFSGLASGLDTEQALYGRQSMICRSANYVQQWVPVTAGRIYTLSAFVFPHKTRNTAGNPVSSRLVLDFFTSAFAGVAGAGIDNALVLTDSFVAGVVDDKKRHSLTFTAPATAAWFRLRLSSPLAAEYVVYDGIQCVVGSSPSTYEPENNLWFLYRAGTI